MKLYLYAKLNKDYSVMFENTDNIDFSETMNTKAIEDLHKSLELGDENWKLFIMSQINLIKKIEKIVA